MKIYNKLIALVAAFGLVGVSYAQDEAAGGNLTDNISIAGFIDASAGTSEVGGADMEAIGIDEVEIDFLFGFGNVSAEVHLDNDGSAGTIGVEQAHITYDIVNGFSVQIGKYGSALGFEREDPAGLYTVSRAYGGSDGVTDMSGAFNLGDVNNNVGEGVALAYSADDYTLRLSFEDVEGQNLNDDSLDTELSLSYSGIDNLAITAGIHSGNGNDNGDTISLNAAYTAGKALVAFEFTDAERVSGTATDAEGYLLLGHYEVSEKLGVALRYSEIDSEDADSFGDWEQVTIAPNYAITDNLLGILEFSDGQYDGTTDVESITLELTLTF